MADNRYSIWHRLIVAVAVLGITALSLGGGVALGYQWGRARAQADDPALKPGPAARRPNLPQGFDALDELPLPFAQQPYLGVRYELITPELAEAESLPLQSGALIRAVTPGSPAERAGLAAGDIIEAVNGQPVDAANPLRQLILAHATGDRLTLTARKAGQAESTEVSVTLAERAATLEFPQGVVPEDFRFELHCEPTPCRWVPEFWLPGAPDDTQPEGADQASPAPVPRQKVRRHAGHVLPPVTGLGAR